MQVHNLRPFSVAVVEKSTQLFFPLIVLKESA